MRNKFLGAAASALLLTGCSGINSWLTSPPPSAAQCATQAVFTPDQVAAIQAKVGVLNTFITDQVNVLPVITAGQRNLITLALKTLAVDAGGLGAVSNPTTPAGLSADLTALNAVIAQQSPVLAALVQPYQKPLVDLIALYTGCPAS